MASVYISLAIALAVLIGGIVLLVKVLSGMSSSARAVKKGAKKIQKTSKKRRKAVENVEDAVGGVGDKVDDFKDATEDAKKSANEHAESIESTRAELQVMKELLQAQVGDTPPIEPRELPAVIAKALKGEYPRILKLPPEAQARFMEARERYEKASKLVYETAETLIVDLRALVLKGKNIIEEQHRVNNSINELLVGRGERMSPEENTQLHGIMTRFKEEEPKFSELELRKEKIEELRKKYVNSFALSNIADAELEEYERTMREGLEYAESMINELTVILETSSELLRKIIYKYHIASKLGKKMRELSIYFVNDSKNTMKILKSVKDRDISHIDKDKYKDQYDALNADLVKIQNIFFLNPRGVITGLRNIRGKYSTLVEEVVKDVDFLIEDCTARAKDRKDAKGRDAARQNAEEVLPQFKSELNDSREGISTLVDDVIKLIAAEFKVEQAAGEIAEEMPPPPPPPED